MKFFERIEEALEKRNRYDLATRLRRFELGFASADSARIQKRWWEQIYNEEREGFAMLQRENYLNEEVAARLKESGLRPLTHEELAEFKAWKKELEEFDQKYWLHRREWEELCLEKPKGPCVREWDASCRREAILSPKNRSRCAARGGCCGRDCGCCEKVLRTDREIGRYGHCMMECGCCIRNRGFYKPDLDLEKKFNGKRERYRRAGSTIVVRARCGA
jgi:hypothetical protein